MDDPNPDPVPDDAEDLSESPDGHLEQRPQWEFEEAVSAHVGRAPFDECMDFALAVLLDDDRVQTGESAVTVELDSVTLLGLAFYQAGIDQYAVSDAATQVRFEVYQIEVDRAIKLLRDPDLAWALLSVAPGHPAWTAGRAREYWTAHADWLRSSGRTSEWDQLRQRLTEAVRRVTGRVSLSTSTSRLSDVLSLARHWNTPGWHASPEFPQPPAGRGS